MFRTAFLNNALLGLALCMSACRQSNSTHELPYYNSPDFTPVFLANAKSTASPMHRVAAFSFTNQYGKQVTEKDVDGKIHIANFIFTKCGSICPVMTKHMKLVEQAFRQDAGVLLLSFSVTPWIDSVPSLKKYVENNGITSPRWHFLTGGKAEIYTLARRSYFAEEDLGYSRDSTEFLHTEHILLVDEKRQIRGIYNGTLELEIEQLIDDIKVLTEG